MCILSETRKPQDQPFRDLMVLLLFFDQDLTPVIENKRNALIPVKCKKPMLCHFDILKWDVGGEKNGQTKR